MIKFLIFLSLINLIPFNLGQRITPTPLVHEGVYKFENQNDGSYLVKGNVLGKSSQQSGGRNENLWRLTQTTPQLWAVTSLPGGEPLGQLWTITYVGHGKYQFKGEKSGKCLQSGRASNVEGNCHHLNPTQRWFPHRVQ